jgi:hypothetical protein
MIGFQQRRKVIDHRIRRERRAGLADGIDDNLVLGPVRDCQREAAIGAAARISESSAKVACGRQHLAIVASAGFDDFERDEALDIRAELGEIGVKVLRVPRCLRISCARSSLSRIALPNVIVASSCCIAPARSSRAASVARSPQSRAGRDRVPT